MRRRVLLAGVALGLPGVARAHADRALAIGGTGTATSLMFRLGQACADLHGTRFEVKPSLGSVGGLRALAANRIDLAVALVPANDPGRVVTSFPIGRTPKLFASHPGVPAFDFSAEELARLLSGQQRRFPDGTTARVVRRPASEREWLMLTNGPAPFHALAGAEPSPGELVAISGRDNAQLLTSLPFSLGLISLCQVASERLDLTVHALGGQRGSLDTLRRGTWPFAVTIHVATRTDASDQVRHFLSYIQDPANRDLLEQLGVLPQGPAA